MINHSNFDALDLIETVEDQHMANNVPEIDEDKYETTSSVKKRQEVAEGRKKEAERRVSKFSDLLETAIQEKDEQAEKVKRFRLKLDKAHSRDSSVDIARTLFGNRAETFMVALLQIVVKFKETENEALFAQDLNG